MDGEAIRKAGFEDRLPDDREALYRTLFEQSPDGVLVIDASTFLPVTFNDQACAQLGYTREEFAALRIHDYEVLESPAEIQAHASEIEQLGRQTFVTQHRTKTGQARDVLVTTLHMTLGDRPVFHAIYRDITESREAAAALRDTELQLRQAQKMEAAGRLAGGMAHDFNNTLTTILGHCDLMLQNVALCEEAVGGLEEIRRAALSAASVTNRLLSFSRSRSLARTVVDLNAVVRNVVAMLGPTLGETVQLCPRLTETVLPVEVDPGDLEHALTNLAINARDAMPQGGRIELLTSRRDEPPESPASGPGPSPRSCAVLEFRDDGVGMHPDTASHIFEPFFTTKEAGKGTGLGLSMVYGMVKRSKGRIEVTTSPGEGTTFTLTFPMRDATDHPDTAQAEPDAQGSSGRGTETILLVEDEPGVRQLVERILDRCGYRVLAADSPGAALALACGSSLGVDLVLTDVVMPEMEGPELVAELRTENPALRALFMSGYAENSLSGDLEARSGRAGPPSAGEAPPTSSYGYLEKPFTPGTLARAVREVLDTAETA